MIFQGEFIHTGCLRFCGEQRSRNRLQNQFASGSAGFSDPVPSVRRGFCAESTGMLSNRHSVFLTGHYLHDLDRFAARIYVKEPVSGFSLNYRQSTPRPDLVISMSELLEI
jgi:hypothetical protein